MHMPDIPAPEPYMMNLAFAFLCFAGVCVMFLYLIRNLEKFQENMRDEHAQLRVQLRALEHRLDALAGVEPALPHPLGDEPYPARSEPFDEGKPLVLGPQDPLDAALGDPLIQFEPRR